MYAPPVWMILPFAALLLMIAIGPLAFERWWAKHYPKVSLALGAVVIVYYFTLGEKAQHAAYEAAHEYLSFIALVGSLYVVSGGIHINVKGEATPFVNVVFLFIGAVIANLLGTTGASMLLIRPWLRMNNYRITAHHVVFFIFIVSNVGGCLTPIGDPPLFLGFLEGVPFWWVAEHCWQAWLVAVGALLVMFFVVDYRNYLRAPKRVREELAEPHDQWRFEGLINIIFLAMILGAVFVKKPMFLREAIMIAAAIGSWFVTGKHIHEVNHFNFHPLKEVAVLFAGIFATMLPALDYLQQHADTFAKASPALLFWTSGGLSSALDNAPTYLCFFRAISGTGDGVQSLLATPSANMLLVAISLGSVFFGANTYIGNGPNFLVKSIADHQKVHTPGFAGYILRFTIPFMLPVLALIWFLFFRK